MTLRFSFLQGFNDAVSSIQRAQNKLFDTQQQVSTGLRVVTPSDDPVASARIIQVNKELSLLGQYTDNADSAENRLTLAETQLRQVSDLLVRIRELTIQVSGPALSQQDRRLLASEVDIRLEELFNLANTRDVNGEYIFAGFQGGIQPFEQTQSGQFVYRGDDGQRLVQVASSTKVAFSDSGKKIFVDIPSAQNRLVTSPDEGNTGSAAVIASEVTGQSNYDNNSYPNDYVVVYASVGNQYNVFTRADILNGGVNTPVFSVPNTGNPVVINADATPSAAPTNLGWQLTVSGTPADGDTFYANSSNKQDLLTTISNLAEGLKSPNTGDDTAGRAELQRLVADTLSNLTSAEVNMASIVAELGARQNTLDAVRVLHEGVELVNQKVLSEIRDIDYAEAVSRLSTESFTLEAAQQSFARVSNLSLFNFLN